MATYYDNLLRWTAHNEREPEAGYVQIVMSWLLALNNERRNRGEIRVTDAELKRLTRQSTRKITAAKERLAELGYIAYET